MSDVGSSKQSGKKRVKRNGFAMFMEERRPALLAAGEKLTRGRRDIAELVSEEWQTMSTEEKKKYAELAKEYNRLHLETGDPPPSLGFRVGAKEDELRKSAYELVDKMFNSFPNMRGQRIVICSFSRVYNDNNRPDDYTPAEIGLTVMSIDEGIKDNFGRIIDPGKASFHESQAARRLHVPEFGRVSEFQDLNGLLVIIEDFLSENDELNEVCGAAPVFVLDSDLKTVSKGFQWLFEKTGKSIPLEIVSLNRFAVLACRQGRPDCGAISCPGCSFCGGDGPVWTSPLRVVDSPLTSSFFYPNDLPMLKCGVFDNEYQVEELTKGMDNYRFVPELSCMYHYKLGEGYSYCPLSGTNCYAFSLLEVLTLSNQVQPQVKFHYPDFENVLEEAKRKVWMLRHWGLTKFEEKMTMCWNN